MSCPTGADCTHSARDARHPTAGGSSQRGRAAGGAARVLAFRQVAKHAIVTLGLNDSFADEAYAGLEVGNIWLVHSFVALLIVPWMLALATVPHWSSILHDGR